MADWRFPADTAVDPDAPVTSDLMYALRDNPVAIAEGAVGAPRIADQALSTTQTLSGRNWIADRLAGGAWNYRGHVVMARYLGSVDVSPGGQVDGSLLSPASADGQITSASMAGTWRLQGRIGPVGGSPPNASMTSLWLRVA